MAAEVAATAGAVSLGKEGYNLASRHLTTSQIKRGSKYLEASMGILKADINHDIDDEERAHILMMYNNLIQQQGKFEGHKKLPQGLRPRTLCEAHDFKAQAKAVYHMASISETSATARAQEKIVKESKGPIKEQCRNTVRGEFDWVDVGPSRRLVARERPANPPCKQTQSPRSLKKSKSQKSLPPLPERKSSSSTLRQKSGSK